MSDTSVLSWRCFTYMGKLSYSLYLVHWPIYIIMKIQFPNSTLSLHIGVAIAMILSILLTETFEKSYLRADMKTIFYLIFCLYAIIATFYVNERPKTLLFNETQWITEMFTPVCTLEMLNSSEICEIPFNRMNLSTREIIRINEFNWMKDLSLVYYDKCSYRGNSAPWGWCDLPSENKTSVHKIFVIGNSYAANQGRIVHEMCASSGVEVKLFPQPACEVLCLTTDIFTVTTLARFFIMQKEDSTRATSKTKIYNNDERVGKERSASTIGCGEDDDVEALDEHNLSINLV
ncbi:hypothetical protein KIN20_019361 [Parelaphostrongylus tenuis]|uniref:Acyltransferase n=1 Tax=Parelaphostrongylus tenuis TaxID=148309 RepID=A0AAD5QSV5_PARTN|nr:hypothetical protein KIN20_019361 [Parelaphostrongylus tenuis]